MSPSGLHERLFPCLIGIVLTTFLVFLVIPAVPPVQAQGYGVQQTPPGRENMPDHALLLRQEVNRSAVITLRNGQIMRGLIMAVDATEITLALDAATLMEARVGISWLQVKEVRVERRARILEGLLLGGAGGALLGIISPDDTGVKRDIMGIEAPQQMWDTALQGAMIGAVAGLIRGFDVVLAPTHQTYSATGLYRPDSAQIRPAIRFINTAPTSSMTSLDIEESLQAGLAGGNSLRSDNVWNGHSGATMAVETSWPSAEGRWWLRSRVEWTTLGRIGLPETAYSGDPYPSTLWREYSAVRTLIGVVYPIGATGRLPLAEVAILGGFARTTLESSGSFNGTFASGQTDGWLVRSKQKVYRPLLMASGSLALVRQPKLAIALRAEGVMGTGFNADALINDAGEVIIPRHRITPIGFSIGIEVLFPNF